MQKPRTIRTTSISARDTAIARLRQLLLKPIWLPRMLYEALPVIYICSGLVALIAALYQPGWTWILPWAIVFAFATLHLGIGVVALRHRMKRKQKSQSETA